MGDYLETLFSRAYDREAAREGAFVESLSFFVAALALVISVLGYIGARLPAPRFTIYSVAANGLMALACVFILGVMGWLLVGIRPRRYAVLTGEPDILAWAGRLRDYHAAAGLVGAALDAAVAADLRARMAEEFALAAAANRTQNDLRSQARTQGVTSLVLALAVAFLVAGTIFVHDSVVASAKPSGSGDGLSLRQSSAGPGVQAGTAAPTPHAIRR